MLRKFFRKQYQVQVLIMDYLEAFKMTQENFALALEACGLMSLQVEDLFKRKGRIKELLTVIDLKESQCDKIERRLISAIFKSDLDGFQKLQLKELVIFLGDISDQVDKISKQINIMSLKRRV